MSIGMGLTFVPVTLLATTNIDAADAGLASGLFNTSQQVGGALGLAILSSIAASTDESRSHAATHAAALVDGFQLAFLVGAGLMLAGAVVIVALLRRRHVEAIGAEDAVPVRAVGRADGRRDPPPPRRRAAQPRADPRGCARGVRARTASTPASPTSPSAPASARRRSSGASRRRTTCSPRSSRIASARSARSPRTHRACGSS